ncbi:MAG TPA: histidine kinase, partial [Rhodospirillales bacterium]|nr:histidine kinase [Rhodospirillales bacterium]
IALARFKTFVGEAILVAHNAAFDLAFLRRKEDIAGVRFDNPVLDTLLLSALLDPELEDHSLDAAAARHGITIRARHSAPGDALATAELFLALVPRLERRGIGDLGAALAACRREARQRQRLMDAGGVERP